MNEHSTHTPNFLRLYVFISSTRWLEFIEKVEILLPTAIDFQILLIGKNDNFKKFFIVSDGRNPQLEFYCNIHHQHFTNTNTAVSVSCFPLVTTLLVRILLRVRNSLKAIPSIRICYIIKFSINSITK